MSPPRRELTIRLISAAVLAAIALLLVAWGGVPFTILVTAFAIAAFWEWTDITGAADPAWERFAALACLTVGLILLSFASPELPFAVIGVAALVALLAGMKHRPSLWTGLGLLYVAIPCAGIIILRQHEPNGWMPVIFIFLVVWATDTGAFFAGRQFGGPKLWPRVSPKKTWSGAMGGLLAGVIAGAVIVLSTGVGAFMTGAALALLLSLATQGGDLLESSVKRHFGVKDASKLIPGHGGVLDRIDGLFAASALAWLLAALGLGGEILALPAQAVAIAQAAP